MLDFFLRNLQPGGGALLLRQLLERAAQGGQPLRVLAPGGHLRRPLRAAGCQVHERVDHEPLDAVCATAWRSDLTQQLAGWARLVRPGGVVVLVTPRGRPLRQVVCAAFLHAGLADPVQHTAGVAVLTSGRVPPPAEIPR
ncbi:MAG: hypothetical protein RMK29_12405 [Myxococcales bacterium]|nr:hypothetical protein [Myxococcota bacterium]MDW8282507.1 hypothetical protein [Myxococcales bacterium]